MNSSNVEIAQILGIRYSTVNFHIRNILRKLRVRSRIEARSLLLMKVILTHRKRKVCKLKDMRTNFVLHKLSPYLQCKLKIGIRFT